MKRRRPPTTAASSTTAGREIVCWKCRQALSLRALFCHNCGAVQPPRPMDYFTRLGLERRFALDPTQLNRQYIGFRRALRSERFAARSQTEQTLAADQADALAHAYQELKEPVRRARYLLQLHGVVSCLPVEDEATALAVLQDTLAEAQDVGVVERLSRELGRDQARSLRELAAAFADDNFVFAAALVGRLQRLAELMELAQQRRSELDSCA